MSISIFGLLIVSVIVLAALALLIYFLIYKSSINKRVKNQNSINQSSVNQNSGYQSNEEMPKQHKVKRMPSPSSVVYIVLAIAVAAVMVGVWLDVRSTAKELSGLCNQLSERISRLEAKTDYLEDEILSAADRYKEEQSLFTSVDISCGKPDFVRHCVMLTISAVPKVNTEDTQISVQVGKEYTIALKKAGAGLYSGDFTVDFYKQYGEIALITITQKGEARSEDLDLDCNDIRGKYGAVMRDRIAGLDLSYQKGKLGMAVRVWEYEGESFFDESSFKLIVKSDGKTLMEESILSYDEKSCDVESGKQVEIYISAVDKSGNTHICGCYSSVMAEGDVKYISDYGAEQVLDESGNLAAEY